MRSVSESGEKPPKMHRVGGADAGAGQHGDRQLGDHRHVDGDPVALLRRPRPLSTLANRLHLVEQLGVGDGAGVAGLALPVEGDLVAAAGLDVAVEAVVARR